MKFVKKPVVVDAVQWWPPGWPGHEPVPGVERGPRNDQPWGVMTLEGFMVASPGDWIITGVKGERYPCNHDIFVRTYDEVLDASVDLSEFHRLTMQIRMGANVGLIYPPVDATIGRVVMGVSSAQTDQDSTSTRPNEDDAIDIKIEPVEVTYGPFTPKGGTLPSGVEFTPRHRDEDDDGC